MTTFDHKLVLSPSGYAADILEAQEPPYTVCQVVPISPDRRDEILSSLRARGGWIEQLTDHDDFAIIHAGGGRPAQFTRDNCNDLMRQLRDQMHDAALWWASNATPT